MSWNKIMIRVSRYATKLKNSIIDITKCLPRGMACSTWYLKRMDSVFVACDVFINKFINLEKALIILADWCRLLWFKCEVATNELDCAVVGPMPQAAFMSIGVHMAWWPKEALKQNKRGQKKTKQNNGMRDYFDGCSDICLALLGMDPNASKECW